MRRNFKDIVWVSDATTTSRGVQCEKVGIGRGSGDGREGIIFASDKVRTWKESRPKPGPQGPRLGTRSSALVSPETWNYNAKKHSSYDMQQSVTDM
jgi:hypothetical protein